MGYTRSRFPKKIVRHNQAVVAKDQSNYAKVFVKGLYSYASKEDFVRKPSQSGVVEDTVTPRWIVIIFRDGR